MGASKPREVDASDELVLLLRQVYKQAFTKVTKFESNQGVPKVQSKVLVLTLPKVRTS